MIQEVITYMVIGSAITVAVMKSVKKLIKKKPKTKLSFSPDSVKMEHNCSDCSSECIIRDSIKPGLLSKGTSCAKEDIKSNQL